MKIKAGKAISRDDWTIKAKSMPRGPRSVPEDVKEVIAAVIAAHEIEPHSVMLLELEPDESDTRRVPTLRNQLHRHSIAIGTPVVTDFRAGVLAAWVGNAEEADALRADEVKRAEAVRKYSEDRYAAGKTPDTNGAAAVSDVVTLNADTTQAVAKPKNKGKAS